MTALEIQSIKLELVKSIINIDSEDTLKEVSQFINRIGQYPCMYSPEELQASADEVIKARQKGDKTRFITQEEMRKKHAI